MVCRTINSSMTRAGMRLPMAVMVEHFLFQGREDGFSDGVVPAHPRTPHGEAYVQ
jgi:hypothetical protein